MAISHQDSETNYHTNVCQTILSLIKIEASFKVIIMWNHRNNSKPSALTPRVIWCRINYIYNLDLEMGCLISLIWANTKKVRYRKLKSSDQLVVSVISLLVKVWPMWWKMAKYSPHNNIFWIACYHMQISSSGLNKIKSQSNRRHCSLHHLEHIWIKITSYHEIRGRTKHQQKAKLCCKVREKE